jgi:hypothetical protein
MKTLASSRNPVRLIVFLASLAASVSILGCSGAYTFVRPIAARSVVFSDVAIFDSRQAQMRAGRFDVRVEGGKIVAIGAAGTLSGEKKVSGGTLLPMRRFTSS